MANLIAGTTEPNGGGSIDVSTAFSNTLARLSWTANNTVAPDGTTTADDAVETVTDANNTHWASDSVTVSNATSYYYSQFVKAVSANYCLLYDSNNQTGGTGQYFDLTGGGSVGGTQGTAPTDAGIVNYGGGWFRVWMQYTTTTTTALPRVHTAGGSANADWLYPLTSSTTLSWWGAWLDTVNYTDWVDPWAQWDVNTRGLTTGVPYDHINSTAGTNTGSPALAEGQDGRKGLTYTGSTSVYSSLGVPAGLPADFPVRDFTMAVRCKITTGRTAIGAAFAAGNNSLAGDSEHVALANDVSNDYGTAQFRDRDDNVGDADSTTDIATGAEGVLVAVRNVNVFTLYWNGTSIGSDADVSTLDNFSIDLLTWGALRRDATPTVLWPLFGEVYWSAIWTRALSTTEIQALDDVPNPFDDYPAVETPVVSSLTRTTCQIQTTATDY